jgi:signal transduction histidine kinase
MAPWLRASWPRSLRGRFVLIMICGVLVAQLISYGIWTAQVRAGHLELVNQASRNLAYSVASTVRFFRSLPVEYRHLVLEQLRSMGGTRFFVSVNSERIEINDIADTEAKRLTAANVKTVLSQELGLRQVLVEFSRPETLRVLNNQTLLTDLPPRWAQHSLLFGPLSPDIMVVQIELSPGSWMYVATLLPVPDSIGERDWLSIDRLFFMSVVIVVVIGLSLFGIRLVTRPLRQMAQAAEALGHDLDQTPLPEDGPAETVVTARAFNNMQARIRRYIADRERLFSAISHDLKTPITRLRLRAEMLRDEHQQALFCKDLEELDMMVKGALQSVKETDIHENVEPVDVMELLARLQVDVALQGKEMSVTGYTAPIRARSLALKRCLTNLIDNAIFYGERADVVLEDSPEQLVIHIYDEGPGIPEDQLNTVFEPYVRLERSRNRNTGGTGLGLGIARSIADSHGGTLTLSNRPGGGLDTCLILPRRSLRMAANNERNVTRP